MQVGTPAAVYAAPASPFVYGFLGQANRIACVVSDGVARADASGNGSPQKREYLRCGKAPAKSILMRNMNIAIEGTENQIVS